VGNWGRGVHWKLKWGRFSPGFPRGKRTSERKIGANSHKSRKQFHHPIIRIQNDKENDQFITFQSSIFHISPKSPFPQKCGYGEGVSHRDMEKFQHVYRKWKNSISLHPNASLFFTRTSFSTVRIHFWELGSSDVISG
jgi:hypothetical protein